MRVFGLIVGWLLILLGGGCTVLNIFFSVAVGAGAGLLPLLLASLFVFGLGILIVWKT
ncbi:MAG: hypothetical protein ABI459_02725 [Deltaproteobacteria bacterium]